MVNRGGITFAYRAPEETGATPEQVARAYIVCREVFDLSVVRRRGRGPRQRRPHRRPDRALPRVPPAARPLGALVPADPPGLARRRRRGRRGSARVVAEHGPHVVPEPAAGAGAPAPRCAGVARAGGEPASPTAIAIRAAGAARPVLAARRASRSAARPAATADEVARSTSRRRSTFAIDRMLTRVTALPRDDRWDALARGALRDDLYAVLEALTRSVLDVSEPGQPEARADRAVVRRPTPTRSPGPAPRSRASSGSRTRASRRCRWRCAPCAGSSAAGRPRPEPAGGTAPGRTRLGPCPP